MQEVVKLGEGEIVAVDGKRLRSSYARHDHQSAMHMGSAFVTANGKIWELGNAKQAKVPTNGGFSSH